MRRSAISATVAFVVLAALGACSGSSKNDGDGADPSAGTGGSSGSAGASGTSGSSNGGSGGTGTAGTAGRGGTGGDGGDGPTGGTAGTSVTGGASGTSQGGQAGGGRECETADDCVMFSDCCNCEAIPKGTTLPSCDLVCITDHCSAQQIDPDEVTCSFGRCVLDRSCDLGRITCSEPSEPCPGGLVGSVTEDGCHGPCLPPTECRDVTDCASCGDAVCVIEEPQIRSFGCVNPGATCTKGNYCECLGACPESGFVCMEADDAVHCPCPVC